jgi:ABC-2 type transport system permease protein
MRILVIAIKELRQLRRDRLTFAMMVVVPIVQLLLFGYAINTDVRHIPTVLYDQDNSAESRLLAQRLVATGFYDLIASVQSYGEIEGALRAGTAKVALVVPNRYASDLKSNRPAQLQLVVDGSDPQTVASAVNTASSMITAQASELLLARMGVTGKISPPVRIEAATWYNPELRTAVFIVPGLIGVILTMTMVMLTSMALARERERGTLEQLIVSPVKRVELIIGKIFPYVSIGYVQMTLILVFGSLIFGVPVIGSLGLLYGLSFVFIAASLAVGMFISTFASTQQQAMQMSFFFLLPNILLSGFMFPFEAMPRPAQFLSQLLPLTHFLRIVRGIVLKGANFGDLSLELLWLSCILVGLITIASLRFRKKLG